MACSLSGTIPIQMGMAWASLIAAVIVCRLTSRMQPGEGT